MRWTGFRHPQAQQRRPCQRRRRDAWLLGKIRAVHKRSGGTYGAPRVHAQLRRDGIRTSRKRVERLMSQAGLQGAFLRKRWRCSTRQDLKATPAPDLVNRQFKVEAPNRLWAADISRIPTGEGRCGWRVAGDAGQVQQHADAVDCVAEQSLGGRQLVGLEFHGHQILILPPYLLHRQ